MPANKTIKFNNDMMSEVLAGRKTVTRRPIKNQPDTTEEYLRRHGAWVDGLTLSAHVNNAWQAGFIDVECPYGNVGDVISAESPGVIASIEITGIKVEQLQTITLGEIVKEGLAESIYDFRPVTLGFSAFEELWDSIYGAGSYASDPWVWVVEFKRVTA